MKKWEEEGVFKLACAISLVELPTDRRTGLSEVEGRAR